MHRDCTWCVSVFDHSREGNSLQTDKICAGELEGDITHTVKY